MRGYQFCYFLFLAYIDSNSEGSDSDLSDVAELDSDVEAEKQVSYARELDNKDLKLLKKEIKSELGAGQKRKQAPTDSLKLQFVHGCVLDPACHCSGFFLLFLISILSCLHNLHIQYVLGFKEISV